MHSVNKKESDSASGTGRAVKGHGFQFEGTPWTNKAQCNQIHSDNRRILFTYLL